MRLNTDTVEKLCQLKGKCPFPLGEFIMSCTVVLNECHHKHNTFFLMLNVLKNIQFGVFLIVQPVNLPGLPEPKHPVLKCDSRDVNYLLLYVLSICNCEK